MNLQAVRGFFRGRLNALGYSEHKSPFTYEDLASTILDDSYHLSSGSTIGSPINQDTLELEYTIILRIFKRGYADPATALDDLDKVADTVLADILTASTRLSTGIKDIEIVAIERLPLAGANDNAMFLELNFIAKLIENY